jgi:hypothetical protein
MFVARLFCSVQILILIISGSSNPVMRRTNDEILLDLMNLDPASATFDLDFLGILIHKAADEPVPETITAMMNSTHDAQQTIDETIMY